MTGTATPEPRPKRRDYHDGEEHVRRELWPDLPDGYHRGGVSGTGYVHVPAAVCDLCGAVVGDTAKHTAFHDQIGAASRAAAQASVMTNAIGPKNVGFR